MKSGHRKAFDPGFLSQGSLDFVPEEGLLMVARQFIVWYPCKKANRPGGYGMSGSDRRATIMTTNQPGDKDQTVPYGTDSRLNGFQAINCLATISQSLRDKVGATDGTGSEHR
jgi:hypothetical protein